MQATAMLLRSSSTPILDCLLVSSPHSDIAPDPKLEILAGEAGHAPMSVNLPTCRAGPHLPRPGSQPHILLESTSSRSGLPSLNRIRKVQSENDLCSLSASGSVTTVKVAANTFIQDALVEDCTPYEPYHLSSSYHAHLKKSSTALPVIGRRRSLGSLPSEFPSVFFNRDFSNGNYALLEEAELTPGCSSAASEADEEEDAGEGILDKIALPIGAPFGVRLDDVNMDVGSHAKGKFDQQAMTQEIKYGEREAAMVSPQTDMVASSSGNWEQVDGMIHGTPTVEMPRNGINTMGLTIAKGDEEELEVYCNGGGGGRGIRPPTITGGGGGSSDAAGGTGGGSDVAGQHYQHVLQKDPGNPLLLRNYAQYLAEVKHDYRRAEEFYERAILASPTDGELLGQYAQMLWEVQHDADRAATYFERAVQAAPENSYVMAAYASFLWSSEEEEEEEGEGQQIKGSDGPTDLPASFPRLVSAGLA